MGDDLDTLINQITDKESNRVKKSYLLIIRVKLFTTILIGLVEELGSNPVIAFTLLSIYDIISLMNSFTAKSSEYIDDGISQNELLRRRLSRPTTYTRAIQETVDRAFRWPIINNIIQRGINEAGDFSIVQIGANDGKRNDPAQRFVRHTNTKSLLVEPVPIYYDMLSETYLNDPTVRLAQVAIDAGPGWVTMHAVQPSSRLRGSSSIHPEVIESAAWLIKSRDTSSITTTIEVPTLSLEDLLVEYDTPHIDWLVVDTEGHDMVVIDQVTPEFVARTGLTHVLWERMHLDKPDQREMTGRFEDMGFSTMNTRRDTFATLAHLV